MAAVKLSLFTDDMTHSMENPKDSTKKLPELIHEFSKVQDIKINAQTQLHFYTPIMKEQKEKIKESIPLTTAPKTIKYLGINLTKEVKNMHTENYRRQKNMEKHPMLMDWKNKYC